jgi:hypothetical protein
VRYEKGGIYSASFPSRGNRGVNAIEFLTLINRPFEKIMILGI